MKSWVPPEAYAEFWGMVQGKEQVNVFALKIFLNAVKYTTYKIYHFSYF